MKKKNSRVTEWYLNKQNLPIASNHNDQVKVVRNSLTQEVLLALRLVAVKSFSSPACKSGPSDSGSLWRSLRGRSISPRPIPIETREKRRRCEKEPIHSVSPVIITASDLPMSIATNRIRGRDIPLESPKNTHGDRCPAEPSQAVIAGVVPDCQGDEACEPEERCYAIDDEVDDFVVCG